MICYRTYKFQRPHSHKCPLPQQKFALKFYMNETDTRQNLMDFFVLKLQEDRSAGNDLSRLTLLKMKMVMYKDKKHRNSEIVVMRILSTNILKMPLL